MITFTTPRIHWNYYLAIERDLEMISRYIEFTNDNLDVYSIALTHTLLSASSEVDVIMKLFCAFIAPGQKAENINHYQSIVLANISAFSNEQIIIPRYGLQTKPWDNWQNGQNPAWWGSYNNVKHQRDLYYREANLKNTINAVGALLLTVVYYYQAAFSAQAGHPVPFKETTNNLIPESTFVKIDADYYLDSLVG